MNKKNILSFRTLLLALIVLLLANIAVLIVLQPPSSPVLEILLPQNSTQTQSLPVEASPAFTQPAPVASTPLFNMPTLPPEISPGEGLRQQGVFILSMSDGNYKHLFAFHPQFLQLTRLTNGQAEDISPAVSPDGKKIAFASRRNGYWDLYILDMETGQTAQLTDTAGYEGNPDWSPDGQWIVYEAYTGSNLDILVRSVADPAQEPIQLTNDPASDHSPVWSPLGREIAFVSNRSGDEEIWLAALDRVDDRYRNVSRSPDRREFHPAWSPDGVFLVWASTQPEGDTLMLWNSLELESYPKPIAPGAWPVWSPSGGAIASVIEGPNAVSLAAVLLSNDELLFPLTRMPGSLQGLQWRAGDLIDLLDRYPLPAGASDPFPKLWSPGLSVNPPPPGNRFGLAELKDVAAPFPFLHDEADESFNALRQEVARQAGWDFLSSLQNAYLPLTEPPNPDQVDNWLYTGRAIAVNPMALYAGWMTAVKEEFNGQTYFRIYLKARYQDGSAGQPLKEQPWDINARYTGDPRTYDQGGRLAPVPSGYWVDFTEIALRYRWMRLPAQVNWRSYFDAARLNIYVLKEDLDWQTAMSEIYPSEALMTPTYAPTRTPTITATREDFDKITITPTPQPTFTPTRRPTWTQQP